MGVGMGMDTATDLGMGMDTVMGMGMDMSMDTGMDTASGICKHMPLPTNPSIYASKFCKIQ